MQPGNQTKRIHIIGISVYDQHCFIYNVEKPCFTSVIGYLIDDVEVCGQITKNGYTLLKLLTSRQDSVDCRYYHAEGAKKAVIWVGGGIGSGWDTQLRSCILTCVRDL